MLKLSGNVRVRRRRIIVVEVIAFVTVFVIFFAEICDWLIDKNLIVDRGMGSLLSLMSDSSQYI